MEGGRVGATVARLAEACKTLIGLAKTVGEAVEQVTSKIAGVGSELRAILGARLSAVLTAVTERFPLLARGTTDAMEGLTEDLASPARIKSLDLSSGKDEAFFWSGRTDGVGGASVAGERAGTEGGKTLEQFMEQRGITMPEWNPDNPASIKAWDQASEEYAKGASGTVRAVIGDNLRPGNTWQTTELPALEHNPAVTKIVQIDPKTGIEKILWSR